MKNNLTIKFFIAAVFVLPVSVYVFVNWYQNKFQQLPVLGKTKAVNGKKTDHTIADFTFTDQDGKAISEMNWRGKIVVANFFFTHCPSICPKMTKNLVRVQETLKNDASIIINSFTVDPEHDDAAALKNYAETFGINEPSWKLLTGDKKELYKLARNSFLITASEGDGGPLDFIHSDKLVLVDKKRRIRGYYDGTSADEVSQLIHDIKKLKYEN